jgi:hypothetical protein
MIIDYITDLIRAEFAQPPPVYMQVKITPQEIATLEKECSQSSSFDPLGFRNQIWSSVKERPECRQSVHGKIIALIPLGGKLPPYNLWFRILRTFFQGQRYTIYYLAHPSQRTLPPYQPIGPENINGGYTYPCNPKCIVIYREEDATRVLIHELLHASCSDRYRQGYRPAIAMSAIEVIDRNEAETEAWAELIGCVISVKGRNRAAANAAISKQSAWMRGQNAIVRQFIKDPDAREFPWRYTIGKEEVWKRWGILDTIVPPIDTHRSLCLLSPYL